MLVQTKLAVMMSNNQLDGLAKLGETIQLTQEQTLFNSGDSPDYLYVRLEGDVILNFANKAYLPMWLSVGDFLGEIGFVMGTPRTATAVITSPSCTIWRLSRNLLDKSKEAIQCILTQLLIALAPYSRVRLEKFKHPIRQAPDLWHNYCDITHPMVQQLAAILQQDTKWDTVIAIWEYVRHMPYRFSRWDNKASETIALGYGNCTTKANLQCALLRANGIEAAISEMQVAPKFLLPLLPYGYRQRVRPLVKHYYAVAHLNDKWVACDATFSPTALRMICEETPEGWPFLQFKLEPGKPYNIANAVMGRDPFDLTLLPDLTPILKKQPFYDADNEAAMNILLDKMQGTVYPLPAWVKPVRQLLKQQPYNAFVQARAGLISDLHQLYLIQMGI